MLRLEAFIEGFTYTIQISKQTMPAQEAPVTNMVFA